jgi:hypothetical protein
VPQATGEILISVGTCVCKQSFRHFVDADWTSTLPNPEKCCIWWFKISCVLANLNHFHVLHQTRKCLIPWFLTWLPNRLLSYVAANWLGVKIPRSVNCCADFLYWDKDSIGSVWYAESSCGLDHISTCFSCSFLDLSHNSKDGNVDIFNKLSKPEYAGINMIHMPSGFQWFRFFFSSNRWAWLVCWTKKVTLQSFYSKQKNKKFSVLQWLVVSFFLFSFFCDILCTTTTLESHPMVRLCVGVCVVLNQRHNRHHRWYPLESPFP